LKSFIKLIIYNQQQNEKYINEDDKLEYNDYKSLYSIDYWSRL